MKPVAVDKMRMRAGSWRARIWQGFVGCCLALSVLLHPAASIAGDVANLETIGFSSDGTVFAFQQSGVQDGSGFPYAEIFFLDLTADRYVEPSPVRVRLDDEGMTVADAMAEARARAAQLFSRYEPDRHRGRVVLDNPPTELSADRTLARFLPRAIFPPIDAPVELRLDILPMAPPELCVGQAGIAGYRLQKIGLSPGEATSILHEDTGIPTSRGCPTDYRLARVEVYQRPNGGFSAAVLIGVERVGFEGPDIRYIAEPVPIADQ